MKRLIRGRVNIGQPSYTPLAYVNQLDDITLELDIYNGNSPLDVTGQTVSLYAKRSNTTVVEQLSGLSTASTKVTGDVKNSCFAVPGITEMQLEFTDSTGKTTVSSFYINVNKSLSSEDSITAGNEIAILTEAKKMEPIRQENERGRVEAEKLRVQAETDRAAAEEIREQQELARQTCYKEIEESRKDFDGGIHKNLKLRLMRDFGDIYKRFNKANLLPYEAEYISASNSYKGMTTDNVIKGRTLQNLWSKNKVVKKDNILVMEKGVKVMANSTFINCGTLLSDTLLKPNTKYTIILDVYENTLDGRFIGNQGSEISAFQEMNVLSVASKNTGRYIASQTTVADFTNISIGLRSFVIEDSTTGHIIFSVIILEGDYTNKPIPSYFEGIKSVNEDGENLEEVSCGKNLLNENLPVISVSEGVSYRKLENGFEVSSSAESVRYCKIGIGISIDKVLGKTVICSCDSEQTSTGGVVQLVFRGIDNLDKYVPFTKKGAKYTFPDEIKGNVMLGIYPNNTSTSNVVNTITVSNIQMEIAITEQTMRTSYDTYKEHRLPIKMKNLRSLPNGVCDTSDGVRRIGKIVLDGSSDENWMTSAYVDGYKTFVISSVADRKPNTTVICDTFKTLNSIALQDEYIFGAAGIYVSILPSKLNGTGNVNDFRTWLQANPTTVYYELATPTKEEGNVEQLRTYDGTTNIFTEGSLINPTISCKVPSNVQAVVMNLREENKTLNNDVNTLQATTEENNLMNIETNVNQEARLTMLELGVI